MLGCEIASAFFKRIRIFFTTKNRGFAPCLVVGSLVDLFSSSESSC
jgi:hypothetical protein